MFVQIFICLFLMIIHIFAKINFTKMLRIFLVVIGFGFLTVNAQNAVQAKVVDGKAFIGHAVTSGETLYGIARSYGISPKDLASFNGLNAQKGLEKNAILKIPITPTTISAKPCTKCATIKYAVQQHEGLYRIGVNFGNIGTQNLTKLNNLTSDNLATGQELIVGYMKSTGNEVSMVDNSSIAETTKPIEEQPVVATKLNTATKDVAVDKPPVVKNNSTKETPKQEINASQSVSSPVEKKQDTAPALRDATATTINADGAFGTQFSNKFGQTKSGTAGVFKSISGWQDKKYYVLINSIEAGAIVKISNPATDKAIYAKVLGQMPNVKGSDALLLRISDAGTAALGVTDETMQVTVNY
jgi:LysM repeat protein